MGILHVAGSAIGGVHQPNIAPLRQVPPGGDGLVVGMGREYHVRDYHGKGNTY
jgi:hypothetical protein